MDTAEISVLVVDDDPALGKVLGMVLRQAGIAVSHANSAAEALAILARDPVDVVITDLHMPEMDGMELLAEIKARWPGLPVILLTAHGTVPLAVEAMRTGAADFILKPFDGPGVLYSVRKAAAMSRHAEGLGELAPAPVGAFVGSAGPMQECYALIRRIAPASSTVLIRGESGTGKELAARAVHEQSPRATGPFIKIHCAALPDTLLESELFGHEKGAFTGAATRKPGRVELAQGGTLFLDEIGDVTPAFQVKLLRLLQDREFERLGGTTTLRADVRFLAATHRDLPAMVARGEFREDLFYRLNVVELWLPPLRERADDVEALARHFCAAFGQSNGKPGMAFEPEALARLRGQPWPGNVRQLQNFVERLVVLADGTTVRTTEVDRELARASGPTTQSPRAAAPAAASQPPATLATPAPAPAATPAAPAEPATLQSQRRDAEREAVVTALQRAQNNRTLAARILGISRRTLYNKLEEYGLL